MAVYLIGRGPMSWSGIFLPLPSVPPDVNRQGDWRGARRATSVLSD